LVIIYEDHELQLQNLQLINHSNISEHEIPPTFENIPNTDVFINLSKIFLLKDLRIIQTGQGYETVIQSDSSDYEDSPTSSNSYFPQYLKNIDYNLKEREQIVYIPTIFTRIHLKSPRFDSPASAHMPDNFIDSNISFKTVIEQIIVISSQAKFESLKNIFKTLKNEQSTSDEKSSKKQQIYFDTVINKTVFIFSQECKTTEFDFNIDKFSPKSLIETPHFRLELDYISVQIETGLAVNIEMNVKDLSFCEYDTISANYVQMISRPVKSVDSVDSVDSFVLMMSINPNESRDGTSYVANISPLIVDLRYSLLSKWSNYFPNFKNQSANKTFDKVCRSFIIKSHYIKVLLSLFKEDYCVPFLEYQDSVILLSRNQTLTELLFTFSCLNFGFSDKNNLSNTVCSAKSIEFSKTFNREEFSNCISELIMNDFQKKYRAKKEVPNEWYEINKIQRIAPEKNIPDNPCVYKE
jgi:hypothetical protein